MRGRSASFHAIATEWPNTVTPSDELFFNLDSADLEIGDETWRVEVCGVHSDGPDHWVQANLHGFVSYSVTVRADSLDAGEVRGTLSAWLPYATAPTEAPTERIVSVATA
jgi:hypothetical protein